MITKIKVLAGVLMIVIMGTWIISATLSAGSSSPGTVNDPLVTRSYVDQTVGNLETELTTKIEALSSAEVPGLPADVDMAALEAYIDEQIANKEAEADKSLFVVVEATKGQKLICGASAELILRAGSATVIQGANGDGLADLTTGVDLAGGDLVPLQHHLLVSRDDGRGFLITSEGTSYIMVKGDYTVE